MSFFSSFAQRLRGYILRVEGFRKPIETARKLGVKVGTDCRILTHPMSAFGSEPYLVSLGDHVTLTSGVRCITHDGGVWVFRHEFPDVDVFGAIRIGNNVFVGLNTIIMPGVTIGDNSVIGAGSVVTRDVPANSVAVGSPAKVVRTIEEYKARALAKATHIRSLPPDQKREKLIEMFRDP